MLTEAERQSLAVSGRDPAEVERQLRILNGPQPCLRLVRPATLGDGLRAWTDAELAECARAGAQVAHRASFFVPASGAATRMSQALMLLWQSAPQSAASETRARALLAAMPGLALWPMLAEHGARPAEDASILQAMFGPQGIGLHRMPKGLVPFHHGLDGPRTPIEAHLEDALALTGIGADVHFTVSADHQGAFEVLVADIGRRLSERTGLRPQVSFSVQAPATDTVAGDGQGGMFLGADGRPVFRPGGHGALLANLAARGGEFVFVRNVDNVAAPGASGEHHRIRLAMLGLLTRLHQRAGELVSGLDAGHDPDAAARFLELELGVQAPLDREALRERLDRPWRVAGMVRNEGQAGGGPFWVESPEGVALQIVESAQIAPDQRDIQRAATHFNPVDIVVAPRDRTGRPYDLSRYTDPEACFLADKTSEGRALRALELPGLWNGQMARWNTVFVEIPSTMFRPVKELADLMTPA